MDLNRSERGGEVKIVGGFEFVLRRDRVGKNGELTWRCREQRKYKCTAFIKTLNGEVLEGLGKNIHSHQGDPIQPQVRKVQSIMRQKAENSLESTRSILSTNLLGAGQDILQRLPKRSTLEDNIRSKKRRIANYVDPNPLNRNFQIPEQYNDIIMYDTGVEDPERILVIGNRNLLNILEMDDLWLGDGTFAVVPNSYFQLYTIHTRVGNKYPPCVYFLLPNKTQNTYVRMLDALMVLIPEANPRTILADFEGAAQNAFHQAYPNAAMKGCLFHLGQSVQRKVAEIGLKTNYQTDAAFNIAVKSLVALAFVPEQDVLERYQEIADSFPDIERADELLNYFELTYIQGRDRGQNRGRVEARYPPQIWNHFSAPRNNVPRTTNAVEGYHNGLNSLFLSQHPSMWKLMDGLRKDMAIHLKTMADDQVANNPPARAKYANLSNRLADKVDTYAQTVDKLSYLRAIAHIISSA